MIGLGVSEFVIICVIAFSGLSEGFLVGLQTVNTNYGEIHGTQSNAVFDGKNYVVNKFLGIPYAEAPLGNLRFQKPLPIQRLPRSPFAALEYGPICPQMNLQNSTMSEDCLTLNVIVPFEHGAGVLRKPVMIWIHGGGFVLGSSREYDPEVLAAFADVIVVTVNYRLGPLGFFSTSDKECPGNLGLWDQHTAIKWVHDNIASFGGDFDNITIFGESAGSSSVVFQTLYNGNRGLFNRAIAESGTVSSWALSSTNSVYTNSLAFAKSLGCQNANHAYMMACLRMKSSNDIMSAAQTYKPVPPGDVNPPWIPVYDRDFTIEDPLHMLDNAQSGSLLYPFYHEVDLMIGWNNYDGCVFFSDWMLNFNITSAQDYAVTRSQMRLVYIPRITEIALAARPTATSINRVRSEVLSNQIQLSDDDRLKLLADMTTEAFFAAPAVKTAQMHANRASATYVYRFDAKPTYRFIPLAPYLDKENSANHADEILFVFGMKPMWADLYFKDPSQVPRPNRDQIRLSKAVMTLWTNFAKSGDPNKPGNVGAFYDVNWGKYTRDRPTYLEISTTMNQGSSRTGPSSPAIHFWNDLLPQIQNTS